MNSDSIKTEERVLHCNKLSYPFTNFSAKKSTPMHLVNVKIYVAATVEEADNGEYEIKFSYLQIRYFISCIFTV